MRRAAKVDANQGEIVDALRAAGCGVVSLAAVGHGIPDLLVHGPFYPWALLLLEIKDGSKPPSAQKLTDDQEKFHARWKGAIKVVRSVDEALDAVGVVRNP